MMITRDKAALRYGEAFVEHVMGGKAEVWVTPSQDKMLLTYRSVKYERFVPYRFNTLYVMQADGSHRCKVGITQSPKRRLSGIQTSSPDRMCLRHVVLFEHGGAREAERAAHKALAHCRVSGEWFDASVEEIMLTLSGVLDRISNRPVSLSDAWNKSEQSEQIFRAVWSGDAVRMRDMTDAKNEFLWLVDRLAQDA